MSEREGIAGRIHRARLRLQAELGREVTTAEIGKALGVTGVTVARWERGEREPDLATIERLAAVLHVTPASLAFGEAPRATAEERRARRVAAPRPQPRAPVLSDEELTRPAVRPPEAAPKRKPKAG